MGALSEQILEHLRRKGAQSEDVMRNSMCMSGRVHPDALGIVLNKLRTEGKVRRSGQGVYELIVPEAQVALEQKIVEHMTVTLPPTPELVDESVRICRKCEGEPQPITNFRRAPRGAPDSRIWTCNKCCSEAGRAGALKAQQTKQSYRDNPGSVLIAIDPHEDEEEDEMRPDVEAVERAIDNFLTEPPHVPLDVAAPETIHMTEEDQSINMGRGRLGIEFLLTLVDTDGDTHRIQLDAKQLKDMHAQIGVLIRGDL